MVLEFVSYGIFISLIGLAIVLFVLDQRRPKVVTVSHEVAEFNKLESPIERQLYRALINNGYSVRSQVKCGPYRIDLVIGDIAIECDGKAYHSSPQQKAHDRKKDRYLKQYGGYRKVIRVSGSSIVSRMPQVIKRIDNAVRNA
jgi:very-short-patch-repair endonuclease